MQNHRCYESDPFASQPLQALARFKQRGAAQRRKRTSVDSDNGPPLRSRFHQLRRFRSTDRLTCSPCSFFEPDGSSDGPSYQRGTVYSGSKTVSVDGLCVYAPRLGRVSEGLLQLYKLGEVV